MNLIKTLPTHAVRRRRFFYGSTPDSVDLAMVGTLAECREYIAERDGAVYRTAHNESGCPALKVVRTKSLSPYAMEEALRLHTR